MHTLTTRWRIVRTLTGAFRDGVNNDSNVFSSWDLELSNKQSVCCKLPSGSSHCVCGFGNVEVGTNVVGYNKQFTAGREER